MRWHPKPPSADLPPWFWVLAPVTVPVVALSAAFVAIILGTLWLKRWAIGPTDEWRLWFAWYPVTVEEWPDEERAWLEWVERRSAHLLADNDYRASASPRSSQKGEG